MTARQTLRHVHKEVINLITGEGRHEDADDALMAQLREMDED